MAKSRLMRVEERRERRRLFLSLLGIIAIIVFLAVFGLRILVGFSVMVMRIKGTGPTPTPSQSVLIPPTLDPQPEATNSGNLMITGSGTGGATLVLYLNNNEAKKLSLDATGNFSIPMSLDDGTNTLSSKITDDKGNVSNLSNVLTILVKKTPPILQVDQPTDGSTVTSDQNTITVSGKAEENSTVTINGRLAIVANDGSFSLTYGLSQGDNSLVIVATDQAGNQTTVNRKVTYTKL